jgi:hypothetical protein
MRKLALMGLVAALACGGGSNGGNNNNNNGTPGLKTFSYGNPQAPTAAQQNTATSAQTQMNNAVKAGANGQVGNAASLPSMTDSLAASLPKLIALPDTPAVSASEISEMSSSVLGHRSGALNQGCYSFTSSTITYNNCTISGSGYNETLNGTLSASAGNVTWNLTVTYSYSAQSVTANGTYTWTGQLAVSSSTIVGQGRSAFSGHVTSGSTTYDYQYTAGFDANLNYQTSPSYCITGGTLEIRRTLNGTSNAGAVPVHDAGAKYTWTGCGAVTVATGS